MEIAYLAPKERRKGRGRGSFPDDNDTTWAFFARCLLFGMSKSYEVGSRKRLLMQDHAPDPEVHFSK